MSQRWYARPILYVADMERALGFYTAKLGFTESWRYAEDGRPVVVQVERSGCELIFSSQYRMKTGLGRIFISLDREVLEAVRSEYAAKGLAIRDAQWGYATMIVTDPDGNELFFPYPDAPPA